MKQLFLFFAICFASYNRKVQQTLIKGCNQIGGSQFDMKKLILFSLLVILGFHSLGQIPAYVPISGLVAWYPFNGNANDESGNGNNLISFGSPAYVMDAFGNSYAASHFPNGNDHLETPSSSWALINNFQQGTVAFGSKLTLAIFLGIILELEIHL